LEWFVLTLFAFSQDTCFVSSIIVRDCLLEIYLTMLFPQVAAPDALCSDLQNQDGS
jgi:hypothetical protein